MDWAELNTFWTVESYEQHAASMQSDDDEDAPLSPDDLGECPGDRVQTLVDLTRAFVLVGHISDALKSAAELLTLLPVGQLAEEMLSFLLDPERLRSGALARLRELKR